MTTLPNDLPQQYALLIGVDCYVPHRLPDGSHYPSLSGCVRDITQVEAYLTQTLRLPDEHIFKLTASHIGAPEPPEPRDQWPTYAQIVAAFRRLTRLAQSGDHIYIHYSGHGGRTPTKFPDLKGLQGLDEALVPTDIGDATARYLRDVELAHLLEGMVDKGLLVTLVLDSCHSGGATRGTRGAVPRGIQSIDTTPRSLESLVASDAALRETWRRVLAGTTRTVRVGSGWLLEPQGYVLLAACRSSESAYEYAFDGKERHGALTYWLLDSLTQLGPGCTYKILYDRILAKVHSQFPRQTPQLEGEGHRVAFGSEQSQSRYAAVVMQVDPSTSRVWVNVGQAHGVRVGARMAIYPLGTTDFAQLDNRLALLEITELGATDSWATLTHRLRADPIEQGAQAMLLKAGPPRLHRTVRLVRQEGIPPTIDQDAALQHVERACTHGGSGFVDIAADGEPADYHVVINARREYEIWDPAGHAIANLRPALSIDDTSAPAGLVQRLVHLTKYRNVQMLNNCDPLSPLAYRQGALGGTYQKRNPAGTFLYAQIAGLSAPRTAEFRQQLHQLTTPIESYRATGIPTFFITSDEDMLIWPEIVERVHAKIPGATLLRVPQAGHSTYFEQPEVFNQAVAAFLQTHRPAKDSSR